MQKILRAGSSDGRLRLFPPPVSWYWWRWCQRRSKALRPRRRYHYTLHWKCLESVFSRVEEMPVQSVLLRDEVCSIRVLRNVAGEAVRGQNKSFDRSHITKISTILDHSEYRLWIHRKHHHHNNHHNHNHYKRGCKTHRRVWNWGRGKERSSKTKAWRKSFTDKCLLGQP